MCANCDSNRNSGDAGRLAEQPAQLTFGAVVGMEPAVPQVPAPPALQHCRCGADVTVETNCNRYCDDCADEQCKSCTECGVWVENADSLQNADGDDICGECYRDGYTTCTDCENVIKQDDSITSDSGNTYCDGCYSDRFSRCDDCEAECETNDMVDVGGRRNTRYVCQHCADNNYSRCDDCRNYVATDDSLCTAAGDTICQRCYENNYFNCDGCNETLHTDDYAQDGYCNNCYRPEHDDDNSDCECRECCDARQRRNRRRYAPPANVTSARSRSLRRFGVELETAQCDGYTELPGDMAFRVVNDGSITGKEFVSAVLAGDEGLAAIERFCEYANRAEWTVDAACGFHAHFDVSDLSDDQCKAVALAYYYTYNVWNKFVSKARRENSYAGPNTWTDDEVINASSFQSFAYKFDSSCGSDARLDRYQWMNLAAYKEHTTFELRIHSATLSGSKVTNWVLAHIRFIDAVAKMTVDEVRAVFEGKDDQTNFGTIAGIWNDSELTEFYAGRAAKFGAEFTQAAGVALADDSETAQEFARA